jgi:hypothetical protein
LLNLNFKTICIGNKLENDFEAIIVGFITSGVQTVSQNLYLKYKLLTAWAANHNFDELNKINL